MIDPVLERIWEARKAISQRCDFDAKKLVQFYQCRQNALTAEAKPEQTPAECCPQGFRHAPEGR